MELKTYREALSQPLRQATLCFLVKGNKILLAMKKRGFGKGKWNGVGGKPEKNEKIRKTVIRETQEEISITPITFHKMATLDFYYLNHPEGDQQVLVYLINSWKGKPKESEEVAPKWFKINNLPFKLMWHDDFHWLPLVLKGYKVRAEFLFGKKDKLLEFNISKKETKVVS